MRHQFSYVHVGRKSCNLQSYLVVYTRVTCAFASRFSERVLGTWGLSCHSTREQPGGRTQLVIVAKNICVGPPQISESERERERERERGFEVDILKYYS